MELSNMPNWFWLVAGAIAFTIAKRKGWIDNLLAPATTPPASPTPSPAAPVQPAQVVEIRHIGPSAAGPAASVNPALTEARQVSFDFDVAVTPRPKVGPP